MTVQNPHITTLRQALEIVGNKKGLAKALTITVEDLEMYMKGATPLPVPLFNDALELVINGQRAKSHK